MIVRNCIGPSRHGDTLNSRRAASPLERLVEGEERWEASDHSLCALPLNWGGTEQHRTVTCMVLKATANNRCHLTLYNDEFRGPRSALCRSALEKVARDSNINTSGNIFDKSIQLLAFADDVDVIARTPTAQRHAFLSLEKEALRMGLIIKEKRPSTCLALNHVLTIPTLKWKSIVLKLFTVSLI
ncbi:uncharacterized protein TNCV_1066241 [Trichonephila clavipes]|nr:uncharacterized protein TNCV_1066241 [Trichonephila clavipes]